MVVLVAAITVVSTAIGGLVALRYRDRLHLVLGFTGGVLLGLVAFELLPEAYELTRDATLFNLPSVAIAFLAGFSVLHLVERAVGLHHEHEYGEHHHAPVLGVAAAATLIVHSFLDGVGVGLAFQSTFAVGIAVSLAVIAHDFADGLNTVSLMLRHGNSTARARAMLALDAAAPLLGAAATLFFEVPDVVLGHYLGFFAGFLLYLATGDILPEAHARHPTRLTMLTTGGGIVFIGAVIGLS
ncbi:MAG: ZIP family metal transporter [Kineosporiaceae bacterium]